MRGRHIIVGILLATVSGGTIALAQSAAPAENIGNPRSGGCPPGFQPTEYYGRRDASIDLWCSRASSSAAAQLDQKDQAWKREHDAKVRAAQDRLNSVTNSLNGHTNAINNAANQIIDIIQQSQRESEARRELQELEEEEKEHQEEMEQLRQELSSQPPTMNGIPALSIDLYAVQRAQEAAQRAREEEMRQLERERAEKARIQSDACKILIEAAALAGQSVDLGGDNACSRDINADLGPISTYGGINSPSSAATPGKDPVLDGSLVPSSVDFTKTDNSALDQLTASLLQPSGSEPSASGGALDVLTKSIGDVSNPSGGALDRLTKSIGGDNGADSNQLLDAQSSGMTKSSALSQLTDQALRVIKNKAPEFAYDKTAETIADEVYEDPTKQGIAQLLTDALSGPASESSRGFVREKVGDVLADQLLDKIDEVRHKITTDQKKVDETPYGHQLLDMLWSMDPANLRKGIYDYPKDMLEKLNRLLDAALGHELQN